MKLAVLFDLDGTLVDSVPDLAAAANTLLAELGRPALAEAAIAGMVGDGVGALVERALRASGAVVALTPAIARFGALYEADLTRLTRPYPGVPETLAALSAAGCPLAICTNKPLRATAAVLAGCGLAQFFPVVLGGDSLPVKKPDPAPLRAALDRLGAAAEGAVMVGDHRNDILAARAAGLRSIFARYGYGAATLGDIKPDEALDRFAELLPMLGLGT
jgi:phosphoglycolate phosphatase